jgi:hypothetical protein
MSQQAVHANLIVSRLRLRVTDLEKDAETLSTRLARAQQQLQTVCKVMMTTCRCCRRCCTFMPVQVCTMFFVYSKLLHALYYVSQEKQQLGEALGSCKDLHARASKQHATELSKLQEQVQTSTPVPPPVPLLDQ